MKIKVNDIIQVFNYQSYRLDLYKVLNIYKSNDNNRIFECKRARFNENKKIEVLTDYIDLIHERDVMNIYGKIERVENEKKLEVEYKKKI